MAQVRIMYWKEIPVQVQARDESQTVSRPLDPRFQQAVDAISMMDGSAGADEYLMAWEWGEYAEAQGDAGQAADAETERINRDFPLDLVSRIRDLHQQGRRDPTPGAIDHWADQ